MLHFYDVTGQKPHDELDHMVQDITNILAENKLILEKLQEEVSECEALKSEIETFMETYRKLNEWLTIV